MYPLILQQILKIRGKSKLAAARTREARGEHAGMGRRLPLASRIVLD